MWNGKSFSKENTTRSLSAYATKTRILMEKAEEAMRVGIWTNPSSYKRRQTRKRKNSGGEDGRKNTLSNSKPGESGEY